jgi:hypothetical protein
VSAGAEAVPVVAGVDFGIGFAILAGLMVGIGTKLLYDYTLGALLNALAHVLKIDAWRIHIDVGGPLRKLDQTLEAAIGDWILANERALGKWWHANEVLAKWTYDGMVDFGAAVHDTIAGLVYGEIPAQVRAGTIPIRSKVGTAERTGRARADAEAHARSRGIAAEHDYVTGREKVTWRGIDDVRTTIRTNVIPRVRANERAIARERSYTHSKLNRRIGLLERVLGVGALSAVAIGALTRVFPYWQCTNVRKLMRGTCRANPAWLSLLFGAGVEALVVADLCDFIAAVSAAAREAAPALLAFVEVEDVLIGCHGASKPARLAVPAEVLPRLSSAPALSL